jgi:hypothetical protein
MSDRWCRSTEKECYWRGHVERQSSSGESIRGYCRGRGLSEASFHFWRRELAVRDREASGKRGSGSAGLIAVEVIGGASSRPVLEIECPGGAVIRLREDVSVEILERVIRACQQVQSGASAHVPVRSC